MVRKSPRSGAALLLMVAAAAAAVRAQSAQLPRPLAELDLDRIDWEVADRVPRWWHEPLREAGAFPLATREAEARRRLRRGTLGASSCRVALRRQLHGHLRPALGHDEALRAIAGMLASAELCEAVMVEGQGAEDGLYLRWRVPILASLADFEQRAFGRIERLLLRDVARWRTASRAPEWASAVPLRRGSYRCALTYGAHDRAEAERGLVESTRESLRRQLFAIVAPAAGPERADTAIAAALDRVTILRRAVREVDARERDQLPRRPRFVAYQLHDVPLGPLLAGLPVELRGAVEVMLRQQ